MASTYTDINTLATRSAHKLATRSAQIVAGICPDQLRRALMRALRQRDPEMAVAESKLGRADWQEACLPNRIDGFEDLTFLFWNTNLNRGLIRMDFDEAGALFGLVRRNKLMRGVEIGRFTGGSTLLLSAALPDGGLLTSIDISPKEDKALANALIKLGTRDRVILETADANTLHIDAPLDFAFIDGDHTYQGAKRDHLRWGQQVRIGGYVVHHDMATSRPFAGASPDLPRLKADILRHQRGELKLAQEIGSLTVFERISDSWTAF